MDESPTLADPTLGWLLLNDDTHMRKEIHLPRLPEQHSESSNEVGEIFISYSTGFSSEIGTKLRDRAVGQAGAAATFRQHCPQMTQRPLERPGIFKGFVYREERTPLYQVSLNTRIRRLDNQKSRRLVKSERAPRFHSSSPHLPSCYRQTTTVHHG